MALYAIAGMDQKIESPVPIVQRIIPWGQWNQRPGYKLLQPPDWIQHETGNERPGTDALNHAAYLEGGAMARDPQTGNLYSQVVSWHFSVDKDRIVQHIPVDEVTWQGADGNGPGNWRCISSELCVPSDGDETKARHNAENLCGQVLKAKGRTRESIGNHWMYNYENAPSVRHHCPEHMLFRDNYWPTFVNNAAKIIEGEAHSDAYRLGQLPDWWSTGAIAIPENREYHGTTLYYARMTYTALRDNVFARAWASGKAPLTRKPLVKGEQFEGIYRFKASGVWWILTKYGSRIRASHCSPWVSIKEVT